MKWLKVSTLGLGIAFLAASPVFANGGGPVCNGSEDLCFSTTGHVNDGHTMTLQPYTPGDNQNININLNNSACNGGYVDSTCPYDSGNGYLNGNESGDEIVTLNIVSLPGDCIKGHVSSVGNDNTELTYCTDSGTDWVLVPAVNGYRLANPYVTNSSGSGQYPFEVLGNGSGNPPTLLPDTLGNVFSGG